MFKARFLIGLSAGVLLVGCGIVSDSQIDKARELCANDGGLRFAEAKYQGVGAHCKNGATYQYTAPDKR